MQHTESKKTRINRRVRIKPSAVVYVGEVGTATLVTDNLYFYVTLDRDFGEVSFYLDYDELEFL